MTTTQDIGDRTSGLGGSDMGAILGLVKQRTPLDVYLEKIGEAEGFSGNEATDLGSRFEDDVAAVYAEKTGCKVRRDNKEYRHPEHPWAMGHIDRRIVGARKILEVKCSSASGWGDEGTDQIPEHMLPQVFHYLALTGAEACDVAALLWGNFGPPTVNVYTVPRDDEMIEILLTEGDRFWTEHVIPRIPPDPTTSDEANKRWASCTTGLTAEVQDDTLELLGTLELIKAAEKGIKADRSQVELALKAQLQDAEALICAGKPILTWKEQTSLRLDTTRLKAERPELAAEYMKESSYRVLRPTAHGKRLALPETTED